MKDKYTTPLISNEDIITRFLDKKTDFELTYKEKSDLFDMLFRELKELEENYNLFCMNLDQFQFPKDKSNYTLSFVYINHADPYKEISLTEVSAIMLDFVNSYTDCEGTLTSINLIDMVNSLYQITFSIS